MQKLKKKLTRNGDGGVTDETWAKAAGETVQSLRRILEEGANAKQALGEPKELTLVFSKGFCLSLCFY